LDLEYRLLIEKLPERDQKILGLYCDGYTQQEIALEIGIRHQNVGKALKKIKIKFSEWVQK